MPSLQLLNVQPTKFNFVMRYQKYWILMLFLLLAGKELSAQVQDSLSLPKTEVKPAEAVQPVVKDSLPRRNEKTILNQQKPEKSMYYKLNYAGHHLHRAGRNVIAVGGILAASVISAILFETVFTSSDPDDRIPKYTLYGGLGIGFIICSTKGGYHIAKAGKSLKDPGFFKQDKTIYDL